MNDPRQILKNSTELNALNERILETFANRGPGPEARALWEAACRSFRAAFDRLSYPGGYAALLEAKAGTHGGIEAAVAFLRADPVHFRSGYIKEQLWRFAPRWRLTPALQAAVEEAALAYLTKQMRRDFWYMCRAMARMGSQDFWTQVAANLGTADRLVAKRASCLLADRLGINAGEQLRRQAREEILANKYE